MRWRVKFYSTNDKKCPKNKRHGLKSLEIPKQITELIPFKSKLIELVSEIKFRKTKSCFLKKLQEGEETPEVLYKKRYQKHCKYHRKTSVLEFIFNKVADLLFLSNRDSNTGEICENF